MKNFLFTVLLLISLPVFSEDMKITENDLVFESKNDLHEIKISQAEKFQVGWRDEEQTRENVLLLNDYSTGVPIYAYMTIGDIKILKERLEEILKEKK